MTVHTTFSEYVGQARYYPDRLSLYSAHCSCGWRSLNFRFMEFTARQDGFQHLVEINANDEHAAIEELES